MANPSIYQIEYRRVLYLKLLRRFSLHTAYKLRTINPIFERLNFLLTFNKNITFLNKSSKLKTFIIIKSFQLFLSASKFIDTILTIYLNKTIWTCNISVEHEDHIHRCCIYLFSLRIPKHSRIVGCALLGS